MCPNHVGCTLIEMGEHLVVHGDGVKDVSFSVEDCRALYKVQWLRNTAKDLISFNDCPSCHSKPLSVELKGLRNPGWRQMENSGLSLLQLFKQ